MLTLEKLRAFGANVEDALKRCVNNEGFYLKLVEKAVLNPAFDQLKEAVEQKDLDRAFELAHSLKGVTANLSLTPLLTPIGAMTELLRNRTDTDYGPLVEEIIARRNELAAML